MDESSLSSFIAILVLLIAQAMVSLTSAALLNLRQEQDPPGDHSRRIRLTQQFTSLLIGFSLAAIVVDLFVPLLTGVNPYAAYAIVLLPLALLVLIFSDLIPSAVGAAQTERLSSTARVLISPLIVLMRPFTWLAEYVLRVMGGIDVPNAITEEELLSLIDTGQSDLEEEERKMIHSVLELDQTTVTEIMIPRIDMIAVEKGTSIAEARDVFLKNGHSRMPVYDDNIDKIIGLIYVKDLLEVWHNGHTTVGSVSEITRPAHFVPETMTADQLLREFKLNKIHMAIVVEEYGGTGGLVTMENLLEEIVGDIQDEYDGDETEDIVQIAENQFRVDAGVVLDDFNEALEVELNDEDVDTLGGFIFNQLERVPETGEVIETEELELRVEKVEGRRIREVYVTRREPAEEREELEDLPQLFSDDGTADTSESIA